MDGSPDCNAVYEGGEQNTVVRLPDSCGGGPFARLIRIWPADDQAIPEETVKKFRKRGMHTRGISMVQNVEFDYDFAKIPVTE